MEQSPNYFNQTLEVQLAQLIQRMPREEKVIITNEGVEVKKNGRKHKIRLTSLQQSTEIDEYLEEFRIPRSNEVELPTVVGDEDTKLKTIMDSLKDTKNSITFEYYYLLGKLIEDYPATMGKKIRQKSKSDNIGAKLINLAKKTAKLFDTIGLSYLSIRKPSPRALRNMKGGEFDQLMAGVRAITAERLDSLLLDNLINELTVPVVSQELNSDAGVVLPEHELDLNSLFDNPENP